jgi:aryl-alcohol dehydrogenase-like predicted oxidoreductase
MDYGSTPVEDQLEALGRLVEVGKVRWVGLSNETPYGLMKFLHAASTGGQSSVGSSFPRSLLPRGEADEDVATEKERDAGRGSEKPVQLPRVVALQNAYSLTCRTFDAGLAECCHKEEVPLLAYSPLAMGLLTGKYLASGGGPPDARLNKYKGRYAEAESRYGARPNVVDAVAAYCAVAAERGMTPVELALRFVLSHPLVASAVVGATSIEQLDELVAAAEKGRLDEETTAAVDAVHARYPSPTPWLIHLCISNAYFDRCFCFLEIFFRFLILLLSLG